MSIHLVMQAYHLPAVLEEARFAILSMALRHGSMLPAPLLLFTDKPEYFQHSLPDFDIIYHQIDKTQIINWQGQYQFIHRMKIKVMQQAYNQVGGSLLYLDTDVFCLQDLRPMLSQIEANQAFMHICESDLLRPKTRFVRRISNFIRSHPQLIPPKTHNEPYFMWNAGLIGLPNQHSADILQQVLMMNDLVYPHLKSHVTEQLAFSIQLSERYQILPADAYFYHYWHMKEFRTLVHRFFDYCHQNQLDLRAQMQLIPQLCPKSLSGPKTKYDKLPKPIRVLRQKFGFNWKFVEPDFLKN